LSVLQDADAASTKGWVTAGRQSLLATGAVLACSWTRVPSRNLSDRRRNSSKFTRTDEAPGEAGLHDSRIEPPPSALLEEDMLSRIKFSHAVVTNPGDRKFFAIYAAVVFGILVAVWATVVSSPPEPHDYSHTSALP
jgi:hypothetical protein